MADKLLFFLGAEWLCVYPSKHGQFLEGEQQRYANDISGHVALVSLLKKYSKATCYLVTDLVEEDFHTENIPHVSDNDRKDIVDRKFEQFYRNTTPFRHSQMLYREQDGRRDDITLFSALTNPDLVLPWLDIMLEQKALIAGIYSVPLISKQLISHITSSHLLLISWQKYSGLREIFYRDGHISFSRLTPLIDTDVIVKSLQIELNRTYKYLNSLSLLPVDQPLDVYIICSKEDKNKLQKSLQDLDNIRYIIEDINVLANRVGLKTNYIDSDATPLILHLLGRRPPVNQYAIAGHTHFYDLWRAKSFLKITVAAAAIICAAWSGTNLWEVSRLHQDIKSINAMRVSIEAQERKIEADYPRFSVSVDRMKAGVSAIQKLSAYVLLPKPFLTKISHKLNNFPMIQVNSLSWYVTSGSGTTPKHSDQLVTQTNLSRIYQEVLISGEVLSSFNLRDTINSIDKFCHALSKEGFLVTPITMPVNLDSGASIAGDLDSEKKLHGSVFVVKVAMDRK